MPRYKREFYERLYNSLKSGSNNMRVAPQTPLSELSYFDITDATWLPIDSALECRTVRRFAARSWHSRTRNRER